MRLIPHISKGCQAHISNGISERPCEFWTTDPLTGHRVPCEVIDTASLAVQGMVGPQAVPFLVNPYGPSPPLRSALRGGGGSPLVSTSISSRNVHLCVPLQPALYFRLYQKDAYLCRNIDPAPPQEKEKTCRSEIFGFSRKSKTNLTHICNNSGHHIKSQFSLTYHEDWPTDGKEVKRHLQTWLKALRRWDKFVKYIWVLEFQERTAPHFHIFLNLPPDRSLRHYLACAWVRITKGTKSQMNFHDFPNNFISWSMGDGQYAVKYAEKNEQKIVPEQYLNVGRFWGCSTNMVPIADIFTAEGIAAVTSALPVPWSQPMVGHYFQKCLRRYHEKVMNYDKEGNRRKTKKGKIHKRKKSPLCRSSGFVPVDGNYKIPNGSKIINQLLDYIVENGPDRWSLQAEINERVPF